MRTGQKAEQRAKREGGIAIEGELKQKGVEVDRHGKASWLAQAALHKTMGVRDQSTG